MKTQAIILKKQNTNEYDQLVTCYTEEFGKITAIAKSILKPSSIQAMHLDLFNLVEFDLISGRGMPIITGAQAEATHPNLKNHLPCLTTAYFFAEVADKIFFEYQKDETMWNFLYNLLVELDSRPTDLNNFIKSKQMELLNILGYAPNLSECAFCSGRSEGRLMAYSVEVKGIICHNCFLNGKRGVVLKDGIWHSPEIVGSIFENLAEKKIYSLKLISN